MIDIHKLFTNIHKDFNIKQTVINTSKTQKEIKEK